MIDPSPLEAIFFAALEKGTPEACGLSQRGSAPVIRTCVAKLKNVGRAGPCGTFLEEPRQPCRGSRESVGQRAPGTVIGPYKLLEPIGEEVSGSSSWPSRPSPCGEWSRSRSSSRDGQPAGDRPVRGRAGRPWRSRTIQHRQSVRRRATPSGRPFFVMELVRECRSLEFCDQNHTHPRLRLELFISVCQAVQHAHQKRIIHRDSSRPISW